MAPARAWGGIHHAAANDNVFDMQHDVLLGPVPSGTLPPTTDMMMFTSPHHLTLMCPSADDILRHELSPACTVPPSAKWFVVPSPRCDTTQWVLSMPNGEISLSSDRHNIWLLTSPHTTGVDGKILTGSWSNVQQRSSLSEYIPPLMSGNQLERVIVHWYAIITSVNPLRVLVLRDGWVTIHGNALTMPDTITTTKQDDNDALFQNLLEQELELARCTNVTTTEEETNTQRDIMLKTWMDERFFSEQSRTSFRHTIVAAVRLRVLHLSKAMREHLYQHANALGAGARCAAVMRFDIAVTTFGAIQALQQQQQQNISQQNPYPFVDFTAVVLDMRLDYTVLQAKSLDDTIVERNMKSLVLQGLADALVIRKPASIDNGALITFREKTLAVQRLMAFFCTEYALGRGGKPCTRKEAVELTRMTLERRVTQTHWQMLIPTLTDSTKRDVALGHDERSLLTTLDADFATLMQRWETDSDKLRAEMLAWDEATESMSRIGESSDIRI